MILLIIVIIGVIVGVLVFILSNNQSKEKITRPTPVPATEAGKPTAPTSPTNSETPSIIKSNFSHEGALFAQEGEDGWTFLWDEPGRLALNVKVKFTNQSICYLGGEKKDCALINMGPESYDRVSLEGERNGDKVTVAELEEIKMPQ